jgi:hypothetical protein
MPRTSKAANDNATSPHAAAIRRAKKLGWKVVVSAEPFEKSEWHAVERLYRVPLTAVEVHRGVSDALDEMTAAPERGSFYLLDDVVAAVADAPDAESGVNALRRALRLVEATGASPEVRRAQLRVLPGGAGAQSATHA